MTVGVRSVNLWVLLNADLRGPQRGGAVENFRDRYLEDL